MIDGCQAEYVRVPHANLGCHVIPEGLTDEQIELNGRKGLNTLGEFIPTTYSSEERRLRKEMCALIHRSYDQGLFTSTQGTFQVRLNENSFLITPYGVDRKYIEPEDIVRIEKCTSSRIKSKQWRDANVFL